MCANLAAAVEAMTVYPPGDSLAIFSACEVAFVPAAASCILGGGPPGGSFADLICNNINVVDRFVQTNVTLQPFARIPGMGQFSADKQNAPASGPFPNFTIDAGSSAEMIASFTTNPKDPAPYQSYVATAEITCAPPGTEVIMSIEGTDNYKDSATCIVVGYATCNLTVPGGREDIEDTVTVTVSNGQTKTVVLVF
jgi:hypothetical protein